MQDIADYAAAINDIKAENVPFVHKLYIFHIIIYIKNFNTKIKA
jgi:hypothetical protein